MARNTQDADITNFIQALSLLVRRGRSMMSAASVNKLSATESSVLARLAYDGPATAAMLARAEGIKPQSMGTIIATLEDAGFIRRKPHATDGRQMNVELTAKGIAMRKNSQDAARAWFTKALDKLDSREQETLFAAGDIIKRLMD